MANQVASEIDMSSGDDDIYSIRGLALNAIQRMDSHEKMDDFRFNSVDRNLQELKECVKDLTTEIKDGFKRNDNRFWSLGISLITLLISCCGFLIWKIISHG